MWPKASQHVIYAADALATLAGRVRGTLVSPEPGVADQSGREATLPIPPDKIVLRVGLSTDVFVDVARDNAVGAMASAMLAFLPPSRTSDAQTVTILARPLTFWHLIDHSRARASCEDLVAIVRELQCAPVHRSAAGGHGHYRSER